MDKIGRYEIKQLIAKGGMGEIYLAYDPLCERHVALKRIRSDLLEHETVRSRFVREARLACALSHPSIIPIYEIHEESDEIFYTMPYIEGETLKEILKKTREQTQLGQTPHPIGSSIPALARIFLSVCQAVDFAHSKGILHRDLKPENILVGKFGEVQIIDWGLAIKIGEMENALPEVERGDGLTKPGKVVGTLSFMAPERAFGHPSTIQNEIYSLGASLYQCLTLRLPFQRPNLKEYRKIAKEECIVRPQERAPYRDIPRQLSSLALKALAFHPKDRFSNVHEMIHELEDYIEGCPEWIPAKVLTIEEADDWEFQETVLLAKQIAITKVTEVMEWVMLMISKRAFTGNMRLEMQIKLSEECHGIGVLFAVPDPSERKSLEDGYCFWLSPKEAKLFHSNVEVVQMHMQPLSPSQKTHLVIELIDNRVKIFLDGKILLNYSSHIPLVGGHVGLLYRDALFEMDGLEILLGSQSVMINCLSVPDAFLQSKDFKKAHEEYKRIAHSFKGRLEGREAIFRAGVTLIEQAKAEPQRYGALLKEAMKEFSELKDTPGAPMEYLGKSLIYRLEKDIDEEIKCLEFAIRKYPKHPLLTIIAEHVVYRLHETANIDRLSAYHFALLTLRHLPNALDSQVTTDLIDQLVKHWEPLPFINPVDDRINIEISLAFWLAKPLTLYEIINTIPEGHPHYQTLVENALKAILELGCFELAQKIAQEINLPLPELKRDEPWSILEAKDLDKAANFFAKYSVKELARPSYEHLLYGIYLWLTEGQDIAMAHYSAVLESPYPPTYTLLAHYLTGNISLKSNWMKKAFLWEKLQLLRQLELFYHVMGKKRKKEQILKQIEQELSYPLNLSRNLL